MEIKVGGLAGAQNRLSLQCRMTFIRTLLWSGHYNQDTFIYNQDTNQDTFIYNQDTNQDTFIYNQDIFLSHCNSITSEI